MAIGLQEGEIKQAIESGGYIRTVLVLSQRIGQHVEYLPYLLPSWKRDLLPLRIWGDKANRTYRDLDRLVALLRDDFAFKGVIPLHIEDDPELSKYKVLAKRPLEPIK